MNRHPKISIIIPVYKAEQYLHRCINSILSQTFTDFELLLIDDGSPDNSGKICDEYAIKDKRIRVFHQINCGVSKTRQYGIKVSKGEYTIHVDPDDWIDSTMLEELYDKIQEDNADMLICDFYFEYKNKTIYVTQKPEKLNNQTVIYDLLNGKLHGSTWNKLIRKKCYENYQIGFDPELSFCEDLYFNISLLLHPIKISYFPKAFYHYDQSINPNAITKKYNIQTFEQDIKLYHKFYALLKNTEYLEQCKQIMSYLIITHAYYNSNFSSKEFKKKLFPYRKGAIKNTSSLSEKILLYLACHGFYKLSKQIYIFTLKLKATIHF